MHFALEPIYRTSSWSLGTDLFMMHHQLIFRRRAVLIGVLYALCYIIWWNIDINISANILSERHTINNTTNSLLETQQYKVFEFHSNIRLQNSTSAKLVPTIHPDERHNVEVIWSSKSLVIEQLQEMAIESMYVRLQRNGKLRKLDNSATSTQQTKLDTEQMKIQIQKHNFTQDELNGIDPNWQIFILESSDGGMGIWPYWFMQHEMTPLFGWKRINYATRSTQNDRYMDSWVHKVKESQDPNLTFDEYYGKPINYTAMNVDGNDTILGTPGCRSIQRLMMTVREDIVEAIDEYVKVNNPSLYEEATVVDNNANDLEKTRLQLSQAIANLDRPMDVRTFWNASVCNMWCEFRNHISEIVDTIPLRHPSYANMQTNTHVVGYIHTQGRQNVHPDYISGLMTTKILVLAQRDRWEGHSRLYEMLLSGALVMSDPQVYWPHGTIDGVNIVVYNSWVDLEVKILYYLRNDEERIKIGQLGRELALTNHRSCQQAERLFLNDMTYRNEYGLSNKPWHKEAMS